MKKLFDKKNIQVVKIRIIQIVLILAGIISFDKTDRFGNESRFNSGEPIIVGENKISDPNSQEFGGNGYRTESIYKETHPIYDGGANGGAIGMALVCATCIICFVLLESLVFNRKTSTNE
jgi:hypothetical protein